MKLEVVKFEDGTYGVRKTSLWKKDTYLSNNKKLNWWTIGRRRHYCIFSTKSNACTALRNYIDVGTVVSCGK